MALLLKDIHGQKWCFIHIYKTGGNSVRNLIYKKKLQIKEIGHIHAKMSDLPDEIFKEFKPFTMIRHPVNWFISLFNYILFSKKHELHSVIPRKFIDFVDFFENTMLNKNFKYQHHLPHQFFDDRCFVLKLEDKEKDNFFIDKFGEKLHHANRLFYKMPNKEEIDYLKNKFFMKLAMSKLAKFY